jgi:hypothetical protein
MHEPVEKTFLRIIRNSSIFYNYMEDGRLPNLVCNGAVDYNAIDMHVNNKMSAELLNIWFLRISRAAKKIQVGMIELENWMYYPQPVALSDLVKIESAYRGMWMHKRLYNVWMACNGGEYQIGENPMMQELWLEAFMEVKPQTRFSALKETYITERKRERTADSGNIVETDFEVAKWWLEKWRTTGYKTVTLDITEIHSNKTGIYVIEKLEHNMNRDDFKLLNTLYPFTSTGDKAHTNLDFATLAYNSVKQGRGSVVNTVIATAQIGSPNHYMTAWLAVLLGTPAKQKLMELAVLAKLDRAEIWSQKAFWKAVSTAVKRVGHDVSGNKLPDEMLASMIYMELPWGRDVNISKWDEEKVNRTVDKIAMFDPLTGEQFEESVQPDVKEVVSELIPMKVNYVTWPEFVKRRQSWVSSGSSGGAKLATESGAIRLNKQAYFETVPDSEMSMWLYRQKPAVYGKGSEKFEPGKARAIYGTMPIDYSIFSYVLGPLEPVLYHVIGVEAGLNGLDEVMTIARRVALIQGDEVEATMLDYADFNRQHTTAAQALLFRVIAKRLELLGCEPDAVLAALWCADALENQWVKFPNDDTWYRVVQGMFSGIRATNFINTLYNEAYKRWGSRKVAQYFSLYPQNQYSIAQGDDVWLTNKSRLWAVALFNWMKASGFVFQGKKQMFDQGRGEFLRVLYGSGGARGYVIRAITTLIMKPVQNTVEVGPADRALSLNSQLQTVYRRGYGLQSTRILWDSIIPWSLQVVTTELRTSIPRAIAMKARRFGGLSLSLPDEINTNTEPNRSVPNEPLDTSELESLVAKNMTNAWVQTISQGYDKAWNAPAVAEIVHKSNVSGSATEIMRKKMSLRLARRVRKWRASLTTAQLEYKVGKPLIEPKRGWFLTVLRQGIELVASAPVSIKFGFNKENILQDIYGAISTGPFKDLPTIQKALGLNGIDAIVTGVSMGRNQYKVALAQRQLSVMRSRLGDAVTVNAIIDGPSVESVWAYWLQPIQMSWVASIATTAAIIDASAKGITDLDEWRDMLNYYIARCMSDVLHDGTLANLSHW